MESNGVAIKRKVYWSDSQTVIGWIRSDLRQYKPFTSHRIAEIQEETSISEWRWVPTHLNAADDATRATNQARASKQTNWITGPDFLRSDEAEWPISKGLKFQPPTEELRPKYILLMTGKSVSSNLIDVTKFSDYFRLQRTVAWVIRFVKGCRSRKVPRYSTKELTVRELEEAELQLCRQAQSDEFADEIAALTNGQQIDKTSSLYELTPCLGEDGLVRLSGRIDAARSVSMSTKRPIILPKRHHLTTLIVARYHKKMFHQNQEAVVCEIRRHFWVVHLRAEVKRVVKNCQVCKVRRAKPEMPIMGQLPEDRLTPYVRPFSYTGLDYFGPILVSIGRRREKRWVALFTCLTIRAVHLELAESLSTDACLLCIRNFVNRRGVPVRIRSDNGTNFVGASKELSEAVAAHDNEKIQAELASRKIEWVFNCPGSPHTGGCWERMVRSIKRVLAYTLTEYAPRVETLRSLLIEAECIVNSRPLTHLPISTEDEEPLTPNHFLIGTGNANQTPAPDEKSLWCLRKQWRISQQLQAKFWKRWIIEYLPTLTRRTKWFNKVEPLKQGDLVIICEKGQLADKWRRGRVAKTFPGPDGQVRSAEVQTSAGSLRKPVSKLAKLDVASGESWGSSH